MRVAFVSYDFPEYSIRLANALSTHVEVLLFLPAKLAAPYLHMLHNGAHFEAFCKPRLRQPLRQLRVIRFLLRRIRDFKPDVIHLQQGHLWFNLALPLLRRYPLVLTIHDPKHHLGDSGSTNTPSAIMNFGFRCARQVIVHAAQLRRDVIEACHVLPENIHVIPHIRLGDDSAQRHIQEEDHVILFFGRIWGYKGLEYLIRAEPLITAHIPTAHIIIAGEGEDFARYRRMMIHPERFTVYNEYVPDAKQVELFRKASVVVLPYIEASQSGVIPVAYTFSKPVVATNVGGLPDMVEDGRTGYLVPPRNEQALADAVVRLLRNKNLRRQLGANGRHKIDTECSPQAVAKQTLGVYCQVCMAHALKTKGEVI